jgi:outer membrane protein OmpA-like peptidoglycan-associated protein
MARTLGGSNSGHGSAGFFARGTVLLTAVVVGLSMFLGGCSNVSKEQYTALEQENEGLRQQVVQEQGLRKQAEQARMSDQQQISNLQTELTAARSTPVQQPPFTGVDTGAGSPRRTGRDDSGRTVGTVNFPSGSATVDATMRRELDRVISTLRDRYGDYDIRLEGHADGQQPRKGKYKSNDELSEARAEAVKSYLVSKGISGSRIDTVGRGSTTSKASREGRRVDVIVIGG